MVQYLVTTNKEFLPNQPIAMVDGTVPSWQKGYWDLHFDHHKPNGGRVQIDEIPFPGEFSLLQWETNLNTQDANAQYYGMDSEFCIVTTQVDADACVAAAWLQLTEKELTSDNIRKLRAIALDCDYLCIPDSEDVQDLAEFAAKAVAALKESTKYLPSQLGLPSDRKTWTEQDKIKFSSECFRLGTEWLIESVRGDRPFPGELGEADSYFEQLERDAQAMRQLGCVRLIQGCAVFDQRSVNKYVDPRCLVAISRAIGASQPITLTARSMPVKIGDVQIPGYSYTLGSLPYHEAAASLDLTRIFPILADAEKPRRGAIGQPPAETSWGGRAAVGGSGWRDASLLSPEEVIEIALNNL